MTDIKRNIDLIVVHCSATFADMDIGAEEIRKWHVEERGWSDIGYHYVIRRNGEIELGRPLKKPGAHAKGFNKNSIGICMVGGVDQEGRAAANFTSPQYNTLVKLLEDLTMEFTLTAANIKGHRDLSPDRNNDGKVTKTSG